MSEWSKILVAAADRQKAQLERFGQALFNTIEIRHPEVANAIRGTYDDPFYASGDNLKKIESRLATWFE